MAESGIDASSIEELRASVRGVVLCDGESGYDEARSVWNGMTERRPAAVLQCRGVGDVMAGVDFAREQGLPLAVKGGGHNVAGKGVCDDGLTLDMSLMKSVRVDPDARRARAEAGALWRDFDYEAQTFGLTTTGGVVSSTGVAGLTLGGGIGYLTRTYGLACDNLLSADVVIADGRMVQASENENADLLWALRGGGGNFGVVTSLEFQLHPVGPDVAAAVVFYSLAEGAEVLGRYRAYAEVAPDEVACYAMIVRGPADLPADYAGQPVLAIIGCYSGAVDEGLGELAPVGSFATPIASTIESTSYRAMQQMFDPGSPHGARYYWKSHYLSGLPDEFLEAVLRFAGDMPGAYTAIGIEPLGGAMGQVDPSGTAYPHRLFPFNLGIWSGWENASEDAAVIAWTRDFFEAAAPFGAGAYVNYLDGDEGGRVDEAYGGNYERLRDVKRKWDPDNLFRVNQNIAP
ncbi:MAG: FAD-binding protein [Pseudomonadales bacterium]|nr:FAD-binding oxidoreductase [Pseudomonadales bacterium]NIX09919.1 FAD-binding protein [Pseudomonadales bacterium]